MPGRGRTRVLVRKRIIVVSLWEPGAQAPVLVGLRYRPGPKPMLSRSGRARRSAADRSPARSCRPTARRSTSTAATDRLWALHADDGTAEVVGPLNSATSRRPRPRCPPTGSSSQAADPTRSSPPCVTTATPARWCGHATTSRRWRRRAAAGADVAYTVVRDARTRHGAAGLRSGGRPLAEPVPAAERRRATRLACPIGHDRRVVTATSAGRVYAFAPAWTSAQASIAAIGPRGTETSPRPPLPAAARPGRRRRSARRR